MKRELTCDDMGVATGDKVKPADMRNRNLVSRIATNINSVMFHFYFYLNSHIFLVIMPQQVKFSIALQSICLCPSVRLSVMVWYGIVEFNVPLDTV